MKPNNPFTPKALLQLVRMPRLTNGILLILGVFTAVIPLRGQDRTLSQTEAALKDLYGMEKLEALNTLASSYRIREPRKALRYGKQAVSLAEDLFVQLPSDSSESKRNHLVQAYVQLGHILYDRENYFEAQENLQIAQLLAGEIRLTAYDQLIESLLSDIETRIERGEVKQNFFSKTFSDINVGKIISDASKDLATETEIKLGQASERKGSFANAIEHYEKAINLLRDQGSSDKINDLQIKIAVLLDRIDRHEEAKTFLQEAIITMEDDLDIAQADTEIEPLTEKKEQPIASLPAPSKEEDVRVEQKNLKNLADNYAKEKDFEKSLAYYKLYQELTQKVRSDSIQHSVRSQERSKEILLLKQQQEIANLNIAAARLEAEKQIRLRNTSMIVALFILLASGIIFYFYTIKRREHNKLTIAYRDLDKTKGKLVNAEQKIYNLLRQQVSGDIAQELITSGADNSGERRFVCIMFLDIRGFTQMAERLSPEELITYQNNVFGFMIDLVQQYHGNINQLLGDGFMATFGAPVSHGNDCQNAFLAAQTILREVRERSRAQVIPSTKVGIGLHAGYVVTGNVGTEARKQYSVTGNPVIIASRVEQLNKTYKSQLIITEQVYQRLDDLPLNQSFLEVEVKGRSDPIRILKIA